MDTSTINAMEAGSARKVFETCCQQAHWAHQMTLGRPYPSGEELLAQARKLWEELTESDILEVIDSHPAIGSGGTGFSRVEQQRTSEAPQSVLDQLKMLNQIYRSKFGFVFLICAKGKDASEIIDSLRSRLGNSREEEIKKASEEIQKINEQRLLEILNNKKTRRDT